MKRQRPADLAVQQQQLQQGQNPNTGTKQMKVSRLLPKKADYRMRAHINPLASTTFPYPPHHSYVNWKNHYPIKFGLSQEENTSIITCNTVEHPSDYDTPQDYKINEEQKVSIIDVGCGFGGLLFGLSPAFKDKIILGMEIRDKLVNFVGEKIRGSRYQDPGKFDNISVVRTNTMRHLCQYFPKASLQKIFICFPDPHFKAKNYRRRIINTGFLSEYAFLMKPQGRLYCITDVLQLHQWHLQHLRAHNMFEQIKDENDPCIQIMVNKTQQGLKVQRNKGDKYWAIFKRK